ncbi:MAG: metallophosphoesterase [Thiogranum sp.]|nr:metallophosphoesterase [Thiogranum sp.]
MQGIQQTAADTGLYFAHLSDPHLTSLTGVRWQQLLNKRLLGYLSWHRRRRIEHQMEVLDALLADLQVTSPGHVVVTGDLTHIGLPDEFRQARNWLERLGNSDAVTVIPGNHESCAAAPWRGTFSEWESYMRSDAAFTAAVISGPGDLFPSLRIRDGVAFIGLSSACVSAPLMATGRLGRAQLERLEKRLRETAEQGLFRVVLLHHSPRAEDEKWRKRLTDSRALCAVLKRVGAELVLHGHGHRAHRSELCFAGRPIPVFGVSSASATSQREGRRAQYALYRIGRDIDTGDWSLDIEVRIYDASRNRFVGGQRHQLLLPAMPSTSC